MQSNKLIILELWKNKVLIANKPMLEEFGYDKRYHSATFDYSCQFDSLDDLIDLFNNHKEVLIDNPELLFYYDQMKDEPVTKEEIEKLLVLI